jgi:hypothetical protein
MSEENVEIVRGHLDAYIHDDTPGCKRSTESIRGSGR